jgi:hypothetical protein
VGSASSSSPSLPITANQSRPQPPAPNSRGPYPAPLRNCARSGATPAPNSNRNRKASLIFRMDFLLADTLSSLIDGVSMPGDCPASLHLLLLASGKQFAPSRTPFRLSDKSWSPFIRKRRSPSGRNIVRNRNGIVFGFRAEIAVTFDRIPHWVPKLRQSVHLYPKPRGVPTPVH